MDAKMKTYASSSAPWRKGAPWYLVIIEGIALAAVGLYALLAPGSAQKTVFAVFGLLLALNGAGAAMNAFRSEPSKRTSFNGFRGGIGLSLGLMALIARFSDSFDSSTARIILGFGYLAVGLVSLAAIVLARESSEAKFPLGQLAWNVILVVIAILIFTGSDDKTSRLTLIGWIALVLGALLAVFGYYLKTQADKSTGAVSAGGAASTSFESTDSATTSAPLDIDPASTPETPA